MEKEKFTEKEKQIYEWGEAKGLWAGVVAGFIILGMFWIIKLMFINW